MKTCFKCNQEKPLSDFYKHPMMGDGHLNKCKECAKRDAKEIRESKMNDPQWVEKETVRCREKARRSREQGKCHVSLEQSLASQRKQREKFPEKNKARCAVQRAIRNGKLTRQPCEVCGSDVAQAHHDDYSKPLNIRWLCVKHHNEHHNEMRRLERQTLLTIKQQEDS